MNSEMPLNPEISITVTQAARRLAYWARRAHDEKITIRLTRHGVPVAKIVPPEKIYTGATLSEALKKIGSKP
jgi:antitoxin (DNA-binding transcriptional repressor) of toxin-antitoxin stability system